MENQMLNYIKKNKKFTKKRIYELLFVGFLIGIPVVHFLVFNLFVNLNAILISFEWYDKLTNTYKFYSINNLFRNFKLLIEEVSQAGSTMPIAARNSLVFVVLNNLVMLPVSLLFTYFLYKKMPCSLFFRVAFQIPTIISVVVMVMVFRFMFDSTIGMIDPILKSIGLERFIPEHGWLGKSESAWTLLIVYVLWVGLGGNVLILTGAMGRVPLELLESAKIDGIGFWGELTKIIFPLIGGTLSTLFLLGIQVYFTFFLPVQLLTNGGPGNSTTTLALHTVTLIKGSSADLTKSATLGMFITILGTPFIIFFKWLFEKLFKTYEY